MARLGSGAGGGMLMALALSGGQEEALAWMSPQRCSAAFGVSFSAPWPELLKPGFVHGQA